MGIAPYLHAGVRRGTSARETPATNVLWASTSRSLRAVEAFRQLPPLRSGLDLDVAQSSHAAASASEHRPQRSTRPVKPSNKLVGAEESKGYAEGPRQDGQ